MRVLFLCQGNMARSPAAELLARTVAGPDSGLEFASSGTGAVVGAGIIPTVAAQLRRRGIDPEGHRAAQFGARDLAEADLVLAMESVHRRWVLEEWPAAVSTVFLLRQAARSLPARTLAHRVDAAGPGGTAGVAGSPAAGSPADWLRGHLGAPSAEDEIADPYRRGRRAAAHAVDRIEEALVPLVSALRTWTGEGIGREQTIGRGEGTGSG